MDLDWKRHKVVRLPKRKVKMPVGLLAPNTNAPHLIPDSLDRAGKVFWLPYSVILAGAGLRGGAVYGESDQQAGDVKDRMFSFGDIELLIEYKTVPRPIAGSISAARRRCRSGTSIKSSTEEPDPQAAPRLGRPVQQHAQHAGARSAGARR